ncbi:MAG: MarR family transcriptional regulator, partial [Acidobacteriota bacterium]|nr:MarR family transcriptional regulator [Acidobacteriota bacterium]
MPEQNDLRPDETAEQPSSGLLLSVEPLTQEGSNTSYRLADDSDAADTSDSDGTDADANDASDSDGTDAGGSDADGTDVSDADGTDTG